MFTCGFTNDKKYNKKNHVKNQGRKDIRPVSSFQMHRTDSSASIGTTFKNKNILVSPEYNRIDNQMKMACKILK